MPLGSEIAEHLPFLRRYARALTGNQAAGDGIVRRLLETAVADPARREAVRGGRVALYRGFTELWRELAAETVPQAAAPGREAAAQAMLARVTPASRQALLLTTIENFSLGDAARIMGLTEAEVSALAREADAEIARTMAADVLIIEDEPLIAMQLEELVLGLGHRVCGTAATRGQAAALVASHRPGLVLADIQLADGSSGLDAVDDILAISPVPAIFITAFPERLLTGDRREPTWLITKPFREESVRVAIAQALFFAGAEAE